MADLIVIEHAVAARAEDAAFVSGNQPVDHVSILGEGLERRFLIRAHEARIPLDVGGEDRGQLALNALLGHGAVPF